MLLRPKRPLPRRFRRPVTPAMRTFAARRHRRRTVGTGERMRKKWRRAVSAAQAAGAWVRQWFWIVVGGVACIGMTLLLFSPLLHVREIRVQRVQGRVDVAAIKQSLAPVFDAHMLFLAPSDVEQYVRQAVPDLEAVEVSKQYPSRLSVRVTVQPLIARLDMVEPVLPKAATGAIVTAPPATTASGATQAQVQAPAVKKNDYLAKNGMYVTAASAESGAVLPTIRVVDWGVRPAPGTPLITPEFLERMHETERILSQEFGHVISQRMLYLRAQEFHLSIGAISLWFDMQAPVEAQMTRYRMFLKTVGIKGATRYVDLRLKGRVVYR